MPTAVLILLIPIYFIFSPQEITVKELADNLIKPYPYIVTSRANETPIDLLAYKAGNYATAISVLSTSLDTENDLVARLYEGVSYLMIDEYSEALKTFDNHDLRKYQFRYDVFWYESLALIKLDRIREAKEALKLLKGNRPFTEAK